MADQPVSLTNSRPARQAPPPRDELRVPLFARALCEGQVLHGLRPLAAAGLEARMRSAGTALAVDRAAVALQSRLTSAGVWSLRALSEQWVREPRFLLRELAALLPSAQRALLIEAWPALLLEAERKSSKSAAGKAARGRGGASRAPKI